MITTHMHIYIMLFFSLSPSSVDHSRICLQLGANDYINASLITVEEAQRNYILTQVSIEVFKNIKLPYTVFLPGICRPLGCSDANTSIGNACYAANTQCKFDRWTNCNYFPETAKLLCFIRL